MSRPQAARLINKAHLAATKYAWGAESVDSAGTSAGAGYELVKEKHAPGSALVRRPLQGEEHLMKYGVLRQMWKRESQLPQLTEYGMEQRRDRLALVEWILNLCDEFEFNLITASLAVALLDALMQRDVLRSSDEDGWLHLIGSCSVVIAAKYHEAEVDVPSMQTFVAYARGAFTLDDLTKTEIFILQQMTWNLSSFVTPAHFLDYFFASSGGAIYPETDQTTSQLSFGDLTNLMQRCVLVFHCLSIKDSVFGMRFLPSKVAAAVIYTSRTRLGLFPNWPADLAQLTSYTAESLFDCVDQLLHALDENTRRSGKVDPSLSHGVQPTADGLLVPPKADHDRVDSPSGPFDRRPSTSGTDSSDTGTVDDCMYECLEEDNLTGRGERMVLDNSCLTCMEDFQMSPDF